MLPTRLWCVFPLLLALSLTAGCMREMSRTSTWDDFGRDWQARPSEMTSGGSSRAGNRAEPRGWAALVDRFGGEHRYRNAQLLVQRLQVEHNVPDLWIEDRGGVASVYAGRFRSSRDPSVEPMLERLRNLTIEGQKPYEFITVEPLLGQAIADADPWDLKQYVGLYTLQVEMYNDAFEGDPRDFAERRVEELRSKGAPAYFYHGPTSSLVTIGLFTPEEAFEDRLDPDSDGEFYVRTWSAAVRVWREQYPRHTINGFEVDQSFGGEAVGQQNSQLVLVR